MSNLIDDPVINSPFEEPSRHFEFTDEGPQLRDGRRPAQYFMTKHAKEGEGAKRFREYIELDLVNSIRKRVTQWRENDYTGVTRITKELLHHWTDEEREKPLFWCQKEAAESLIWLTEAPQDQKVGIEIPAEHPESSLERFCCKMATGTGKTVLMGMLISWQILNKATHRQDDRFTDSILVVCPNLTIRDRLKGGEKVTDRDEIKRPLIPNAKGNYYEEFNLVPSHLRDLLNSGSIMVTNWHKFQLKDDQGRSSVLKRGKEGKTAFCKRVLKELDLDGKANNIFVINDEAHHAYRHYEDHKSPEGGEGFSGEDIESDIQGTHHWRKDEEERSKIWIKGLDRIDEVRGIRKVVDLTATPYFLESSGRTEGEPFDWIISDYGLLDAIESGIVKVPHVPTWDNAGQLEPKYRNLYKKVRSELPSTKKELKAAQEDQGIALLQDVQDAIETLANEWKQTKQEWEKIGRAIPPCMIIVCNNTATAALIADYITGEGKYVRSTANSPPELQNKGQRRTIRIDSERLKKEDIKGEGQTQQEAAEEHREILATVGKEGEKGEQIRCVISVGMLNEGWDAQNVTHILGLRAFSSPLLCEQVIGRGLRRFNYDVDPDGYFPAESCVVYGIPFEVLPIAETGEKNVRDREVTVVKSLPSREEEYQILFPRVIGYVNDVKYGVSLDWDSVEQVVITPEEAPTKIGVSHVVDQETVPQEFHSREEFYANNRVRTALFNIASRVTAAFKKNRMLFPQVLDLTKEFFERKVEYQGDIDEREVCLEKYVNKISDVLLNSIQGDDQDSGHLPVLDPYNPVGSTSSVRFQTSLSCVKTRRSHISHVACHSEVWERNFAVELEDHTEIESYVRNYKLGFKIPFSVAGESKHYEPDFIVQLNRNNGGVLNLVLEVKGRDSNSARLKAEAARKWVRAVNNWGKLGEWEYARVMDPSEFKLTLDEFADLSSG